MSKLLRFPLTLLAVLAALLFLPGVASAGGTPSAGECADNPSLAGCTSAPATGDVPNDTGQPTEGADQPTTLPGTGPDGTGATADQPKPAGGASHGDVVPANRPAGTPALPAPGAAAVEPAAPAVPPGICTSVPTAFPTCAGATNPPSGPLTCDQLAALLGGGAAGCPAGLSCQQLADLLGVTCPAGPPTCEALAAMFHLDGCPAPPTSCQEFAALLSIDNCSQIPCLDTSQLPALARDGLAPLLAGLKDIGVTECPAKPTTGGGEGTVGTSNPPPVQQAAAPGVFYANCDDARAHGATNIPRGAAGYRPELDSDNDGIACETDTQVAAAPAAQQPTGKLAFTGFDLEKQLTVAWTLLMVGSALAVLTRRRA